MMPMSLGPKAKPSKERELFAKCGALEDYDTIPRWKNEEISGLFSLLWMLERLKTNIVRLLLIIMVTGIVLRIVGYISPPLYASSSHVTAASPASLPMIITPALLSHPIVAAPQAMTVPVVLPVLGTPAVALKEITSTQTSRYNHNYFCTVKRTRWMGSSSLAIDFILVGDRSLGDLQDPLASTLSWVGGKTVPKKHTYEVDDLRNEFVEGTLFYEGVPQGKTFDFQFGSSGYSWVKLASPSSQPSTSVGETVPSANGAFDLFPKQLRLPSTSVGKTVPAENSAFDLFPKQLSSFGPTV